MAIGNNVILRVKMGPILELGINTGGEDKNWGSSPEAKEREASFSFRAYESLLA